MYRNQVKMVGGFLCEMSLEERNRWTEFIQSQDEFLQYCILKNKLDKVCEIERIEKFTKELNIIETKLYELGKEWCKNNIKQDLVPLFNQLKDYYILNADYQSAAEIREMREEYVSSNPSVSD